MKEELVSKSEIIAVKVKMVLPKQASSGLIVGFFDIYKFNFLGHFSLVISGSDLGQIKLTRSYRDLIDIIRKAGGKYSINHDLDLKLKTGIETRLNQEFIKMLMERIQAKDVGSAENLVKRSVEGILTIDKAEVQMEFDLITSGEYAEVKVEDDIEKMTFAQKIKIVMSYADNKVSIAENIVRDNIHDLLLIKVAFYREGALYGNGFLTISILSQKVLSVIMTVSKEKDMFLPDVGMPYVDFYHDLTDIVPKVKSDPALISKIDRSIKMTSPAHLGEAAINNKPVEIKNMIGRAIGNVINQEIRTDIDFSMVNSLRMELLLNPEKRVEKTEEERDQEGAAKGLKVISADLILAPSRGKNLSSLKAGEPVQVILDASNPTAGTILKKLNLIVDNKTKPLGAVVYSIKHAPKSGYTVYVKIADGILGKAVEEQDVRIKMGDPVVEEEMKQAKGSMVIGIIAGLLVLLIIVALLLIF